MGHLVSGLGGLTCDGHAGCLLKHCRLVPSDLLFSAFLRHLPNKQPPAITSRRRLKSKVTQNLTDSPRNRRMATQKAYGFYCMPGCPGTASPCVPHSSMASCRQPTATPSLVPYKALRTPSLAQAAVNEKDYSTKKKNKKKKTVAGVNPVLLVLPSSLLAFCMVAYVAMHLSVTERAYARTRSDRHFSGR